jgi:uncharacterized membrane protein YdjX (TVP38/TMEM64 family)
MAGPFNKKIGSVLLIAVVVAAAVAASRALGRRVDAASALQWLREVQGSWWALPAYVGIYLASTTLLFPALLLHMVVGAAYDLPRALAINLALFNGTALLQFWAARRLGRDRVQALLRRRGVSLLDEAPRKHGVISAILVRFLPLPSALVAAAAGVSSIRPRDFALGTLIGAMPAVVVYTYFASALVAGVAGAERRALLNLAVAAGVVLAFSVAGAVVRARLRQVR